MQYFKRDIETTFLKWKETQEQYVLMVEGARQVGKTTTIKHFAENNFNTVIFISAGNTDECSDLCKLIRKYHTKSNYLELAFGEYAKARGLSFVNEPTTAIIIDEIQESKYLYEKIREFNRSLKCRVIVTGSYLQRALGYFQPAGDLYTVKMYPLSFMEFIDIWKARDFLEGQKIDSWDNSKDDWFKSAYEIYCQVGGYPSVVIAYLNEQDYREALRSVLETIFSELTARLPGIINKNSISSVMLGLVNLVLREKKGDSKFMKHLTDTLIDNADQLHLNKEQVKTIINWLVGCGLLNFCGRYNFDTKDLQDSGRVFFNDMGMLSLFLGERKNDADGIGYCAENFIFKSLNERLDHLSMQQVLFGLYKNGEIDFYVVGNDNTKYAIEVKANAGIPNTGRKLLNDGYVDYLIVFKMGGAGATGKIVTLPIYAADLFKFNREKTPIKMLSEF